MTSVSLALRTILGGLLVSLLLLLARDPADAATVTGNFQVKITIQNACAITSLNDLDFGTQNVLTSAVTGSTTLSVHCSNTTPYNIGLDTGTGAGATLAARKMTGPGAATITYSLYQNSGFTLLWGDVIGANTVAGTGTGGDQNYTVYGQVPAQSTPAPGLYTDTILVTVTF